MGNTSAVLPLWIGLVDRVERIHEWSDYASYEERGSMEARHMRHLLVSLRALSVLCPHAETRNGLADDINHIIERINLGAHNRVSDDARGTGADPRDLPDPRCNPDRDAARGVPSAVPCAPVMG